MDLGGRVLNDYPKTPRSRWRDGDGVWQPAPAIGNGVLICDQQANTSRTFTTSCRMVVKQAFALDWDFKMLGNRWATNEEVLCSMIEKKFN